MKNKAIITVLCLTMGLGMATTSCQDMLESESDRYAYAIAGDTLYSYWGIMKSLQNLGEKYVLLGECRGDLVQASDFPSDSLTALLSFGLNGDTEGIRDKACRYLSVSDYYHVINSCNAYLAACDTMKVKPNGKSYMAREYAQVEAIRAWTYMQLVINYGEVPFYLEPLLTTDEIKNFQSKNVEKVNASNLYEKFESRLIKAFTTETELGYPQYGSYGKTTTICDATKAMFPAELVLADLYLMSDRQENYAKAAQYYWNFFRYTGGALPTDYYSTAYYKTGDDSPTGSWNGTPWNETGAVSKDNESITAIPSSVNVMWGTVLRGINDMFGFTASLSQSTGSDSITSANINLTRNWEQQLTASDGYENLRKAQKYEIYESLDGSLTFGDTTSMKLHVIDGVGDARGVPGTDGTGYISRYGSGDYYLDHTDTKLYIMKQNPSGKFSTVYPMVYRQSQVWLRFAEALNRAGYPGFAFAILKNGLTRNESWLPTNEYQFVSKNMHIWFLNPKDTKDTIPSNWYENDLCKIKGYECKDDGEEFDRQYKQAAQNILDNYADQIPEEYQNVDSVYKYSYYFYFDTNNREHRDYENWGSLYSGVVCDYISKKEMKKSSNVSWLNFDTYFNAADYLPVQYVKFWPILSDTQENTTTEYATGTTDYLSRGIHSKGCGYVSYLDKTSTYNYVDQINLKLKAAGKKELTQEQIYSGNYDDEVTEAIEDLIVDEEALELAFEGSRFFDLMRVARRRSDPGMYMYKKINARDANAKSWASGLKDMKNWYFPLPDNSYRSIN